MPSMLSKISNLRSEIAKGKDPNEPMSGFEFWSYIGVSAIAVIIGLILHFTVADGGDAQGHDAPPPPNVYATYPVGHNDALSKDMYAAVREGLDLREYLAEYPRRLCVEPTSKMNDDIWSSWPGAR